MKQKTYNIISGTIFFIVAILHLVRVISNWQISVGGLIIPLWLSWIGFIVAGVLAYLGLKLSKQAQ